MAEHIISVENISKYYTLNHEAPVSSSFRDMLTEKTQTIIRRKSHVKASETFWALKNINFKVEAGTCLGIIGKNGAGKSTLLKILSRITTPSSGLARLYGRTGSLLEVGTGFHGDLTGRENIMLNGSILGMKRREILERFDAIIAFAEVEKFLDTPVKHYSSGMYMRLAFSIAAHLDPEILIIDEVLAVGDQNFQQKCLGKMEDIRKQEGRTILFVSHKMDAIHTLCNRAIILDKGELIFDAPPGEAIAQYLLNTGQQYSASFQADPAKPSITSVSLDQGALHEGHLKLMIQYESPYEISDPVPGFVIYNAHNIPIMGSNPRYHEGNFETSSSRRGTCIASVNNLELHSGKYKISVWFGDHYHDYDMKPEVIIFDHDNPLKYLNMPDPLFTGSIDKYCNWLWKQS
jgi:lipopolysaccharide transport system ATP-binding protein